MDKYSFNPEEAFGRIERHWKQWAKSVGATKWNARRMSLGILKSTERKD